MSGADAVVPTDDVLVCLQTGHDPSPIFLVHPLQGILDCYGPLIACYGGGQTFYGLRARGLLNGQVAAKSVEEMARDYVERIVAVQSAGPYLIAGYSLGAMIALEIGHLLRAQGREVPFVVSIEHNFRGLEFLFDADQIRQQQLMGRLDFIFLALVLQEKLTLDCFVRYQRLESESDRLAFLVEECGATERFAPGTSTQEIERTLQVYRANFDAALAYEAKPGTLRVAYLLASECFPVLGGRGTREYLRTLRPSNHLKVIKGANHLNVMQPPHAKRIADLLRGYIASYAGGRFNAALGR